jgi:hypothetical protein
MIAASQGWATPWSLPGRWPAGSSRVAFGVSGQYRVLGFLVVAGNERRGKLGAGGALNSQDVVAGPARGTPGGNNAARAGCRPALPPPTLWHHPKPTHMLPIVSSPASGLSSQASPTNGGFGFRHPPRPSPRPARRFPSRHLAPCTGHLPVKAGSGERWMNDGVEDGESRNSRRSTRSAAYDTWAMRPPSNREQALQGNGRLHDRGPEPEPAARLRDKV